MPSVALHTLGCKLNFADTDRLARSFKERDYEIAAPGSPSDVTVINSCSVTDEADRKCRQLVRRALKSNPESFVVVTGCYAQLQPGALASIPGVDLVLGMKDKFRLFDVLSSFEKRQQTQVEISCIDDVADFESSHSSSRTRTFVKIQDGCDYSCSFCTIPMARGRSRSDRAHGVVDRIKRLADAGTNEVVLSGVNLGLFGSDTGESLLGLFEELDKIPGIQRYRISSIEPNLLTDALIDFVLQSRSFVPHFHLPLQSGDDYVLGKMRRRYRSADYANRVQRILRLQPDACIGADVIVGFPDETEERFLNTYRFIESLPVAYLHVFTYSPRPNTVAQAGITSGTTSLMSRRDRTKRNGILRGLSESKRQAFYRSQIGTVATVLWEGTPESAGASQRRVKFAGHDGSTEAPIMYGHTDNYVKVRAPYSPARLRTFERVRLASVTEDSSGIVVIPADATRSQSGRRIPGAPTLVN